jgi:hypothetical protein
MSTLDGQTEPDYRHTDWFGRMLRDREKEMAAQMEKATLTVDGIVKLVTEANR